MSAATAYTALDSREIRPLGFIDQPYHADSGKQEILPHAANSDRLLDNGKRITLFYVDVNDKLMLVLRTISCRLYPTPAQEARFYHYLNVTRILYNHSLEQRIRYYKDTGKSLSLYSQQVDLTALRSISQVLADVPAWISRGALDRLDRAYQAFFRRVKEKAAKVGFPRFKSSVRWRSFSSAQPGKCVNSHDRIRVSGVDGLIRTRGLRDFTGKIKVQRIVLRAGKWHCRLVVDDGQQPPPIQPIKSAVGIDLGLEKFAVLSTGEEIDNPRLYRKAERKLARANRNVSRKVKGSANRRNAVARLQRVHERIANLRWHFTHSLSKKLVREHQLIAVEDLNIAGMVRGNLGKSIMDAGWRQLLWQVNYKAEKAGCLNPKVRPHGTSQDCSSCGQRVQKDLSVRVHSCPNCGLSMCRDKNAALNILHRAINATPADVTSDGKACGEPSKTKPVRGRGAVPRSRKSSITASRQ